MAQNINRLIITANLTRDPELKSTGGGMSICNLRIASNARRKDSASGEWVDKVNYFDVVVFGAQAENCNRYLAKGRSVAIDGRLDFQEWERDGQRHSRVQIIADTVQFLHDGNEERSTSASSPADAPPVSAAPADDDIPF